MIKAVLLDIDDTLLDFNACSRWSAEHAAAACGVELPPETMTVFRQVTDSLWHQVEQGRMTQQEVRQRRWVMIFRELGIAADGLAFEHEFLRWLHDSCIPVEGAGEMLASLAQFVPLYAASNGPLEQQTTRLARAGFLPYFNDLFVSEVIGYTKPDPRFFSACLERLDLRPDEVILLGDSLTADIRGAMTAGLLSCWFNPERNAEKNHPDYTISRLAEFVPLLKKLTAATESPDAPAGF